MDHERDSTFTYAAMEQFRGKYLVQDRFTKKIFETPQVAMMLIGATLFHDYPAETRMKWIKEFYECVSKFEISLPTPVMAGVRTSVRQFSSCVLIESGDSLDSICNIRSNSQICIKKSGYRYRSRIYSSTGIKY